MREILFRGKRIDNGEWVEGCYDINVWLAGTIEEEYFHYIKPIDGFSTKIDPLTVGQFTGLCDKNGKKIFEGDIVLFTYGKWYEEPKGLTRFGHVLYDAKTCAFRVAVKGSKVLVAFGDTRSKDIEVICTIYDKEN